MREARVHARDGVSHRRAPLIVGPGRPRALDLVQEPRKQTDDGGQRRERITQWIVPQPASVDAARDVGALRTAELDLSDPDGLELFFAGLPTPIDHVFVTGGGPMYVPIADLDFAAALRVLDEHLLGALRLARAHC